MVRLHIETTLPGHVTEAIDLIDEAGAACEWDNVCDPPGFDVPGSVCRANQSQ